MCKHLKKMHAPIKITSLLQHCFPARFTLVRTGQFMLVKRDKIISYNSHVRTLPVQVNPFLPFPPPFHFLFSLISLPSHFPSPSVRTRHHIAARGSGERLSSSSGSWRNPAAKRFLVNFKLKIAHLVAMVLRSYS